MGLQDSTSGFWPTGIYLGLYQCYLLLGVSSSKKTWPIVKATAAISQGWLPAVTEWGTHPPPILLGPMGPEAPSFPSSGRGVTWPAHSEPWLVAGEPCLKKPDQLGLGIYSWTVLVPHSQIWRRRLKTTRLGCSFINRSMNCPNMLQHVSLATITYSIAWARNQTSHNVIDQFDIV